MQKYLILLLVVFMGIFAPAGFAADDQPDNPWAQLTEQHPFTVDPSMPHGFPDLPSADTTPFYIRYNKDIYFKIPRNYLLELSHIKYGHADPEVFFRVEMLYPTFSGATADTLQHFEFRSWDKSADIILIMGPFLDKAHPITNMLEWEKRAEHLTTEYGLKKDIHSPLGPDTDVYFTNDPKLGRIIFSCNTSKNAYGITDSICSFYVNLTDDLICIYQYNRNLLPQWKTIHEHVLDFINSSLRKG